MSILINLFNNLSFLSYGPQLFVQVDFFYEIKIFLRK